MSLGPLVNAWRVSQQIDDMFQKKTEGNRQEIAKHDFDNAVVFFRTI